MVLYPEGYKKTYHIIREITAPLRYLPNYLIIGAQKCGTASLFYNLSVHPQVKNCLVKETHYFEHNFHRSLSWYRGFFPIKRPYLKKVAVGEATPNYLFHPLCAERIYKTLPNVKLIILLRNPVERAISHYFQALRKNNETRSIKEALTSDEDNINFNEILSSPKIGIKFYKSRGKYAEQIERYFKYFTREQILILSSKEFYEKPNQIFKQVCRFLEIEENLYLREITLYNVGTNKVPVDREIIEYLENYFKPYNEKLFDLLGYKIEW